MASLFTEFQRWRRLNYVVIGLYSIFIPVMALLVAAVGTREGFPLPMKERIGAAAFALIPTHYIPFIAHRLLRRGRSVSAIVLGIVAGLYLLPLFPFGTYGSVVMLYLVSQLRKAPVWLYSAKSQAAATEMAREQLKSCAEHAEAV